ncbi:hypothetical protein MKW94_030837 [Papaver nudicaule]|uniref:Uncharacterized protein n=1 Tax=Papaver nudicaule TaxID=74823 RepID=A0AA41S631_PAPNU|nr:hypothetical protein [Papaver nudicaule]
MEAECNSSNSSMNPWKSSANWVVTQGSLDNSISFETPLTDIDDEITLESTNIPKDQLQLISPSSTDSGPCEITISFGQQHQIQLVYLRSTARVYEIYYSTDKKNNNEYLCTVKCSPAAKEDASLIPCDTREANGVHPEEAPETVEVSTNKIKSDSSQGTNEDDWVDVKTPVSPFLINSLLKKSNENTETNAQEFYEATAEITDVDPCISITLRLLSLQTQGCTHLGEIYIFGEPVDPDESESQGGGPLQNSTGNSLMAMLVPTLLQLSKSGNRTQEKTTSDKKGFEVVESLSADNERWKPEEAQSSIPNGRERKFDEASRRDSDLEQVESGKQIPGTSRGSDFANEEKNEPYGRIERILDHLVARIIRMENFCLRFEEKMLIPISSIDTRLQRLEKQLEILTVRSQFAESNPGTRFRAPEFSDGESPLNSFYSDGHKPCTRITAPELSVCDSLSNSLYDDGKDEQLPRGSAYGSTNIQCTRKNAPKLSDGESESRTPIKHGETDDHEFRRSESAPEILDNKCELKNSVGGDGIISHSSKGIESGDDKSTNEPFSPIEDANVSSALPQLCPGLVITAPEFSSDNSEEDDENGDDMNCLEVSVSAEKSCSISKKPSLSVDDALASALAGFLSTTSAPSPKINQTLQPSEANCKKQISQFASIITGESAADRRTSSAGIYGGDVEKSSDSASCLPSQGKDLEMTVEFTGETNLDLCPVRTPIYEDWFTDPNYESQISNEVETYWNLDEGKICTKNVDVKRLDTGNSLEGGHVNVDNIFEQTYSSAVDFELPILDVNFVPLRKSNARSPLEALLGEDAPQSEEQDSHAKYSNDADDGDCDKSVGQTRTLSMKDETSHIPSSDFQPLWLMATDDLTEQTFTRNEETEHTEDSLVRGNGEPFSSLI